MHISSTSFRMDSRGASHAPASVEVIPNRCLVCVELLPNESIDLVPQALDGSDGVL